MLLLHKRRLPALLPQQLHCPIKKGRPRRALLLCLLCCQCLARAKANPHSGMLTSFVLRNVTALSP